MNRAAAVYPLNVIIVLVSLNSSACAGQGQETKPASPQSSSGVLAAKPAPIPELNVRVLQYCKGVLGQRVGDGQCSALAQEALATAGARFRFKPSPASDDFVWGEFVCRLEISNGKLDLEISETGKKPGSDKGADVKPGDVIQFRDVRLGGRIGQIVYEMTYPHHTAVVESVSSDGATCTVYEQNVRGRDYVAKTTLRLGDLSRGWLRVYRPIARGAATVR